MKIAMMVRGYITVPRPVDMIYAPIDLALGLSEGLQARGHEVDFYAPLGSETKVRLQTSNLRPLAHNQAEFQKLLGATDYMAHYVPALWDNHMALEMFERANRGEYDILHFQHPEIGLPLAGRFPNVPVAYTLNDPIEHLYNESYELYKTPNQHFIAISNNQRRDAPDLPYASTVYNGVNLQSFPFSDQPEDYLLMLGRIVADKGFKEAIQIAKQTNNRLLIIGPTYPGASQDYFDQYIKPQLSDQILYLGYIEYTQTWRYFQKAKAFLTPVQWEEPFGVTTIEAMACGTPVISLRRGAAPEIIVDGKTGFVVDSVAEMAAAVGKIDQINRADCRDHVKEHFSMNRMVDAYEATFENILRAKAEAKHRRPTLATKFKRDVLPKIKAALPGNLQNGKAHLSFEEIVQEITETASEDTDPSSAV